MSAHEEAPETSEPASADAEETKDETRDAQIVHTLTSMDIQKLFSGTPRFSTTTVSKTDGSAVEMPWESKFGGEHHSRDCPVPEHPIYSLATLRKHLTIQGGRSDVRSGHPMHLIDAVESPSMLSAHGIEKGSVGLDHFLQLPLSDSHLGMDEMIPTEENLKEEEENLLSLQLQPEKLGLAKLNMGTTSERLAKLSRIHTEVIESKKKTSILDCCSSAELYDTLFTNLLAKPAFETPKDDPASLKIQIEAILKVLNVKGIWFDFSQVDSRIRIGQLLWGLPVTQTSPETPGDEEDSVSERDRALLQITISSELLLRLDAVSTMEDSEAKDTIRLKADELKRFRALLTLKVNWDLVLARLFLDNVVVKPGVKKSLTRSFLRRIPKRFFFPASLDTPPEPEYEDLPDVLLLPRHQERQLDGLIHFATSISWPDVDELELYLKESFPPVETKSTLQRRSSALLQRSSALFQRSPSAYATPSEEPSSQATDYFDSKPRRRSTSRTRPEIRPQLSRVLTKQKSYTIQSPQAPLTPSATNTQSPNDNNSRDATNTAIGPMSPPIDLLQTQQPACGWLTRAYLTSLVLPGEPLQHHLISALLENSPAALATLGDTATLYGGLVYGGRSYWSRSCAVGRVLACMKGSAEGWGWIGTSVVPMVRWNGGRDGKWKGEGWVDVAIDELPSEDLAAGVEARVRQKEDIEKDSDPLAGQQAADLKPSDLAMPTDAEQKPRSTLWFDGLRLERQPDTNPIPPAEDGELDDIPPPASYKAFVSFSSMSLSSEIGSPTIPLLFDVYFISAFPCTPPSLTDLQMLRLQGEEECSAKVPGHPLHTSQRYNLIPAADVLKRNFEFPSAKAGADGASGGKEVLVLDVRGSVELELLARAWCSWKGEHAILGRAGVTCLACCVREARAAGVRVVIRLG